MRIILASESPRRRQLLTQVGIPHEVLPSGADETISEALPPARLVQTLAQVKAQAVRGRLSGPAIIIAADTVVYINGQILGKPRDDRHAYEMLSTLQGGKHTVYTGVALLDTACDRQQVFCAQADVYFRSLGETAIRRYIATGEPFDKAGAYGIQEKGAALVARVEGDFYAVVGLPIARVCEALEAWGVC